MVRAAGQDGHRAVDLLGQHHAGQGVRPGLGAEGQGLVGPGQHFGRQAVGAADHEHQPPDPVVAQLAEAGGEGARGVSLAVLVAGDDVGVVQVLRQQFALGALAGLSALEFDDFDGPQAQGAAGGRRPLGVVADEAGLGRAAQPRYSQQGDLQLAARCREGASTDQIFSML